MAWVTIANVRGPRGYKGDPGDPLNQAGWQYMKDTFDALDGADVRAPYIGSSWESEGGGLNARGMRQTWLEWRATDGGPSDWGLKLLGDRLGVRFEEDGNYLYAVTDAAGRFTDVELRKTDGKFSDRVVDGLAPRIADRIGSGGSGLSVGDRYVDANGDLQRMFPDLSQVYGLGSSSMQGLGPYLESVLTDTVATFHNEGKSGEVSEEIFARLGSRPALLTVAGGSIPSSGAVGVTASNMGSTQYLKPFSGVLNGVHGVLSWSGTETVFTRSDSGSAVTVPNGTPFIPDLAEPARKSVAILWAGKNNVTSPTGATRAIEQTDQAFDWFSPMVKRVLVLGHFVDNDVAPDSIRRTNVEQINAAHKARYGDLFVDVAAYLASAQLWIDTGITPTTNDLAQQADGLLPDSVASNPSHLNDAGYQAVANLVRTQLSSLGWYI